MRIALVAPLVTPIAQPYLGGAQAIVADLAQGLVHRKHHVTLFAQQGSFVPGVSIEAIAVPHNVLPARFTSSTHDHPTDTGFFAQANLFFELFLQLKRRQTEFDLLHIHAFDWPAFICSALVSNLPVIHTIHLPALSPAINEALRVLHNQGHPLTLVTVSHACAHTYQDYTPMDAVIYNGLNISTIPFCSHIAAEAPLLFAGRISPEKGVEAAIEIAQRAQQRLLIAGGIYDQQYYTDCIEPRLRAAEGRVDYLGHVHHAALWKLMGQCQGLLFPIAWDEPFGLTAVEAMATGTPVIAFRRGATPEIIRHGETGFLVEPGACEQAATLVGSLAELSRIRCRTHVEHLFSLEHMLDEYEHVYCALAQ